MRCCKMFGWQFCDDCDELESHGGYPTTSKARDIDMEQRVMTLLREQI